MLVFRALLRTKELHLPSLIVKGEWALRCRLSLVLAMVALHSKT
jgi:hypothetical protein